MSTGRDTIRLYWQQARKHKASFFIALACIPLAALCINALLSFFFSQAIGALLTGESANVIRDLIFASLAGLGGFVLNLIGFQALVRHESHIITLERSSVFERLINKDLRFFINEKVGSMTSKYIDFIRGHIVVQDLLIIRTLGLLLSLSIGIILIGMQSIIVAAVIVLLIVALVVEVKWSIKIREPYRKARRELRSEIHGHVADSLTSSLVVKTFVGEDREIRDLNKLGEKFNVAYLKDLSFVAKEGSFRILIMIVTQIIAISISTYLVTQGSVSVATVIFCLTYLQLVGSQLFTIGDLLNGYEEALLEASPMTKMLLENTHVNDEPGAKALKTKNPDIVFEDVSYHYSDQNDDVLSGINLTIPTGQKIGLVGHSGAGKTTITHLLLRFGDVTSGKIMIDGYDLRQLTQKSLRKHIAYVPQEPILFHRSLRENIAYGKPKASEGEILEAARKAHALEFIAKLPSGLDTLVGERGVKLSGGQRQRIAIARAILKDAPILVLDEATSALDSESEKLIQDALQKLMKGRTSIVIAHRLSTIAKLDRIIVLENGKIKEDGSHAELLAQKGTYAKLWAHQSGGFLEE
jgi:ATP-binding cassette, subfamily B, bacterial